MSKITLNNVASFQNDSTAVASYAANNATLTTAFDNTLSRDGTSPNTMGANLDMNSNRILNLPAPASSLDPVRVQDLSSYVVTTANQITVPSSTTSGNVVTWNATNGLTLGTGLSNTGSGTVNVLQASPTINNPNIVGTATNDSAASGSVGEFLSSQSGSIALSTGVGAGLTSITLTAGDWDVWGFVQFSGNAATVVGLMAASISTSSGAIDTANMDSYSEISGANSTYFVIANVPTLLAGYKRVSVSGSTTYFVNAFVTFSVNTCNAIGKILARRRR